MSTSAFPTTLAGPEPLTISTGRVCISAQIIQTKVEFQALALLVSKPLVGGEPVQLDHQRSKLCQSKSCRLDEEVNATEVASSECNLISNHLHQLVSILYGAKPSEHLLQTERKAPDAVRSAFQYI